MCEMFYVNFYRPQTKFAKVIFLHLFVSHSVHRGACVAGVCAWWGACMVGACVVEGACMAEGACVVWQILRDMVNERVVRILLECILVYDSLLIKHLVLRQRVTYPVVS